MKYGRRDNLARLPLMAAEAEELGYGTFAEYCRQREKGLHKEASEMVGKFIGEMLKMSNADQRKFVEWHQTHCFLDADINEACPKPLQEKLIRPTVQKWIKQFPDDPTALRWSGSQWVMSRAVELSPADPLAVGRYAVSVLVWADYTTGDLPQSYQGENAQADLSAVESVLKLLDGKTAFAFAEELRVEGLRLKAKLEGYLGKKK